MNKFVITCALGAISMPMCAQVSVGTLPPFPSVPEKMPYNSVKMLDADSFPEVQLDIPITEGPYQPCWASIEENYPGTPQWLRDAKFGIWVHFGPQSAGQSGDWYARKLYNENENAYANHLKNFGHPSEVGYKEVLHGWNPTKLDPDYLTRLYQKAGARFLMIQGVHHDNYDLWNSQYQPWNSVNIGPHRDLLGEWAEACRKYGMRYGVTFHHEYTWWWWQAAFGSDSKGEKAGVPYDGNLTLADGKGKWWEGYDPRMLYGIDLREYETVDSCAHTGWSPPKQGIFHRHLDYCNWYATQWVLRMMDVTANYDPDFIYTDGTVQGPFTGQQTGAGYKSNAMQTVMADYYNRQLRDKGAVDAFTIIKFRDATNGTITTEEFDFPREIRLDQDWIREAPIGDWFYKPGIVYDAPSVIRFVVEAVSRDGNAALNVCLNPEGEIDSLCVEMLEQVGRWMDANGEAIYGSYAWTTLGEGADGQINTLRGGFLNHTQMEQPFSLSDIRYTVGKDGSLYAITMAIPEKGDIITLRSLGSDALGEQVQAVEMLGSDAPVAFGQGSDSLTLIVPESTGLPVVFKIVK